MPHEQMVLPFEGEVLSIVYKDEIPATVTGRFPEQQQTVSLLKRLAWSRAKTLGFRPFRYSDRREVRGNRLHIWLRADAERT